MRHYLPVVAIIAILISGFVAITIYQPYMLSQHNSNSADYAALFTFLGFFEGLSFGAGLFFLLYNMRNLKNPSVSYRKSKMTIVLAVTLLLISWWPHDYAHAHNDSGTAGLLYIEYGFHVTSIIVTIFLAYSITKILNSDRNNI